MQSCNRPAQESYAPSTADALTATNTCRAVSYSFVGVGLSPYLGMRTNRKGPNICAFVLTFCLRPQIELLGRVQKQQQDDAWYTCINYVSVCGKPLYGFTPAQASQAPAHEQKDRRLSLGKVSSSPF